MRLDGDAAGVDLGAPAKRLLDLAFDLARRRAWLELDQIGDPLYAAQPAHGVFGRLALVIPLDLAFERDPAVLDDGADMLRRERQPGLDRRNRVARNVGVWLFEAARQANLEVVCQSHYTSDPFRCRFRLELLRITLDEAGQADDAVFDGYPDIAGINVRIPSQLVLNVAFDIAIGSHCTSSVVFRLATDDCRLAGSHEHVAADAATFHALSVGALM